MFCVPMTDRQQAQGSGVETADERMKVAARCCECGCIYSAWIHSDDSVRPIGRPNGCKCGGAEFESLSG
jgi:hypothetical protein